ncbi:hypothetical protein PNEG_03580 [Pneumocystis murina B123]|uniref:Extracellular mutant protein 11 C-terminal domain-containing protein n=1 Tax=Pneumocystis murina (strain B123) TaxID=1069680 RepID=M7NLS0_PNEMU|nr:hypothetical protein PNEG_03580 [Pneumocystis murina B123]EMR08142.1 hypothetical protein PNEG_03580 [Pneumocystis murina B123]
MPRRSNDTTRIEPVRAQQNSSSIPSYFPRFPRKSYLGRYGTSLTMAKTSIVDLDESETNDVFKDPSGTSNVGSSICQNELSIVLDDHSDKFVDTSINGSETSIQSLSDEKSLDSTDSFEKQAHTVCDEKQADVLSSIQQTEWKRDAVFTTKDVNIEVKEKDISNKKDEILSLEQELREEKHVDHNQLYDEKEEINNKEASEVSVDESYCLQKNEEIVQEESCNHVSLDVTADDSSSDIQASQKDPPSLAEESYISLSVYPKGDKFPPPSLPDDFSEQERAYAMLTIKEWEDKGLEISKRGFQLIEKVILLRKRKEELLFEVQNMIDVHAEKLIQREESLRLRALDVKKRGRELLDDVGAY